MVRWAASMIAFPIIQWIFLETVQPVTHPEVEGTHKVIDIQHRLSFGITSRGGDRSLEGDDVGLAPRDNVRSKTVYLSQLTRGLTW